MSIDEQQQNQNRNSQRGITCPRCGCGHFRTIYTRHRNKHIQRRRECRHCQHRITTREQTIGR
jgi:transcriptional regulator NrdR family protein